MVTGTRLFPGSDIPKLLRQRLYATISQTGLIHAMLSDHFITDDHWGAIHCNPNDRYANANTFAEALRGVQRKTGVPAQNVGLASYEKRLIYSVTGVR